MDRLAVMGSGGAMLAVGFLICAGNVGTSPAPPVALSASTQATISPVPASTARCGLRQDRAPGGGGPAASTADTGADTA
jgi:hypothetical protein